MKAIRIIRWISAFLVWSLLLLPYLPIGLIGRLDDWLHENKVMNRYASWAMRVIKPLIPKKNDKRI